MQNVTPMLARKDERTPDEPYSSLPGGVIGLLSFGCALAILLLLYGSNALFFFLYTWPFFLALLPISVVIGIVLNLMLRGHLLWSAMITVIMVVCLFWLLFSFLSGW